MKLTTSLFSLICLFTTASAQAQMYKSVGPDGKITYSDVPPTTGTVVEQKKISGSSTDTANLPYELAQAVKNNPVTLYSSDQCSPCDDGRKLLKERGVPFSEKSVNSNDDIAQLRKISGENQLPVLMIGSNKQGGFEASSWNNALTTAGYPQSSRLPKNYRNGQTSSAAPSPAKPAPVNDVVPEKSVPNNDKPLPAPSNTPPGFQF